MSETRAPYHYANTSRRIAYPGSSLELLAEALDMLKATVPNAYEDYATIHQAIEEALDGSVSPNSLTSWLLEPAEREPS